jgi:TP901 family phage tail tape measure protein
VADAQKTIDLIFNGVDKTGAATLSALNNAKTFTSSLKNVTQPIADFTVGALKLEAGLLAAGLAMTVFAVKTAGDFDGAFRQISTIIDASAEDLAGFKGAILDYAEGSTQPLDKITTALANAIGSGVDWSKSLDLIATAEKLAAATRSDLDSTTKVLVSTLNSYGMEISDAGGLSDLFFKIIDEGDISMTDLANSFAKVAPIAKISGVSLQEVGAAIATLTASGIKPAESIEYLRGAISNIISPSSQAKDLAAELGIEFSASGLAANGLSGTLQAVAEKTGGSADKMKILFGDIGGFTAAATLAGPQADKFAASIVAMGNVTGATDEAFNKMAGSLETSTGKISSAFNVLLVNIGTPLLDEFGGIANAISKIFEALSASVKDGALDDLLKYIEDQFGGIQAALETVAKNLPAALEGADFSGFKGGIDALIGALKLLFSNIDITTVNGLKSAIELAGAAFLGLSKYATGVIEAFKPLFDALVSVGKGAKDVDLSFLQIAGNLGGVITQLNAALPLFQGLLGILTVKGGLGILVSLKELGLVLPGVLALLTGPAGFALALTALGYESFKAQTAIMQLIEAKTKLSESEAQGAAIQNLATDSLTRFSETTGIAVKSINEADQLISSGTVVWSTAVNGWVKAGDALADVAGAAQDTVNPFEKSNQALIDAANASDKAAGAAGKLASGQKDVTTYTMQTVPVFDALTGKITGYEQRLVAAAGGNVTLGNAAKGLNQDLSTSTGVMDALSKKTDLTNKELIDLAKVTKDAEVQLATLASNERIKNIEANVSLNIANLEANTKIATALIEGISNTITSTGDVLGGLFGQFKDFDSMGFSQQWKITEQIDKENKLRQEAFDLQKKLTEAQIEMMKAQTDALANGEGLIQIDGSGLKPHLEAFMWEILSAIQVKVNRDGLKMLLGV